MEEYVTKNVDVKRVISPNDSLLLESANNIVIDTDVDRIMIGGMRIRDYVHREIFSRGGVSTSVVELEASSSAAAAARTNFDAIYSGTGEFRTEETRCATLDASGSFIDGDRAHVITLEGANELHLNAKSVDNIYVGARTLREVIYALMNEYRLENRHSYEISAFEEVPVQRSALGRESARMGSAHTNTLRTYKITTNHTLIEGRQPDLVIRSTAGVQIDTPNFYLNNQLFREYIKQFLDERAFFTLTVDTSPGSVIPYEIKDFAVVEHGNIFDYEVRLFMYQEDITSEEVESGVGVHEDESSLHVINLSDFPYGAGKPHYRGNFESLTAGSVYNMYADLLNLRTMTLVPKVYVMGEILTVVLKGFKVSILNETYLKIVVDMYQEELAYGSNFKFNLLLNKSSVPDPPSDSYLFNSPPNKIYATNTHLTQDVKLEPGPEGRKTMNGVFIYDESNNQLRSGEFIEQPYLYHTGASARSIRSNYVINFNSNQSFRLYTPLLDIFSPVLELDPMFVTSNNLTSNDYRNHFNSNLIDHDGPMASNVPSFNEIRYEHTNSNYVLTMNAVNLSSNWPIWPGEKYAETSNSIPKFDYIQFVCSVIQNTNTYFVRNVSNVIKYRSDFSNALSNDMEIHIPNSTRLLGHDAPTFQTLVQRGHEFDTEFILQYQDIYGLFDTPSQTGSNFVLDDLLSMGSISASGTLSSTRTYTIGMTCTRPSFRIVEIKISNTGTQPFATSMAPHYLISSNDSNFTVEVPANHKNKTLYTECTIEDDLERRSTYSNSTYTGTVGISIKNTATYVTGSTRKYAFYVESLSDVLNVVANANDGSFNSFTSANISTGTPTIPVTTNPVPANILNGKVSGEFTADDTTSSNIYEIVGIYTDQYGFFGQGVISINIPAPTFSTPIIESSGTLRTFTISVGSGSLSNYQWKLSTTNLQTAATQLYSSNDTGQISCIATITNPQGFTDRVTTTSNIPNDYRSTPDASNSFEITGTNTFTATIHVDNSNYVYTPSAWNRSIIDIFDYKIVGKLIGSDNFGSTNLRNNYDLYHEFELKLQTYTPTGFVSSSYNYNRVFNPVNPQAVQDTSNDEDYFGATITFSSTAGTNGTPSISPTEYQIRYKLPDANYPATFSTFVSGSTLSLPNHSTEYNYQIKKVVPSSYGYSNVVSSDFSVSTLQPVQPAAPTISSMTLSETTIIVTITGNSNGTPAMSPTYSLFHSNTSIASNLSAGTTAALSYNRSNGAVIKLEKIVHPDFLRYDFSNQSDTKTLSFTEPTRSIAHTTTHFRNYTKIVFTTTSTGPADSSYTFSFQDGTTTVESITYHSNSASDNSVGEQSPFVGELIGGGTFNPWNDNRSEVFTETNSYLLYTTLSAASVTTNIQLRSVFGIASTTSDDVTYTYNNVTVDSNIKGFNELGQIRLQNDSNYITKVKVINMYATDKFYFRNSLRDDVRNNIVLNKSRTYQTASTETLSNFVYINGLEPGRFTGRNYSCAFSNGSFTSPNSNFTDINIDLAPQPTLTIVKSNNDLHFTTKIRGAANYYPTDAVIDSAAVISDSGTTADTNADDFTLSFTDYDSNQTFVVSNRDVATYTNMCIRFYYSTPVNRFRTSPKSIIQIVAPTAPTFALADVDTSILGALKFAYNDFTSNSHGDFGSLFTGYTVVINGNSNSVTSADSSATLSGLTANSNYIAVFYKTYSNDSATGYSNTLDVSTRAIINPTAPTWNGSYGKHILGLISVHIGSFRVAAADSGDFTGVQYKVTINNEEQTYLHTDFIKYWRRVVPNSNYDIRIVAIWSSPTSFSNNNDGDAAIITPKPYPTLNNLATLRTYELLGALAFFSVTLEVPWLNGDTNPKYSGDIREVIFVSCVIWEDVSYPDEPGDLGTQYRRATLLKQASGPFQESNYLKQNFTITPTDFDAIPFVETYGTRWLSLTYKLRYSNSMVGTFEDHFSIMEDGIRDAAYYLGGGAIISVAPTSSHFLSVVSS